MQASPNRCLLIRPFWRPLLGGQVLGVSLMLCPVIAAVRGIGILGPPEYRWILPLSFTFLILLPWVFLNRQGRHWMGLRKPASWSWMVFSLLMGIGASLLIHMTGFALFGESPDNWYVSVERAFPITEEMAALPRIRLFWIITIPALIFSPLGEEFFFRGILHQSVAQRWTETTGLIADASFFGLVHLFHHGIVRIDGEITFLPVSGMLWFLLIAGVALLFAWCRRRTRSIYGAVLAHAGFNLGMNYAIFYL